MTFIPNAREKLPTQILINFLLAHFPEYTLS